MRLLLPFFLSTALYSAATTHLPMSEEEEWRAAEGALRGRVESVQCTADPATGRPVTRAVIAVKEAYRGRLPQRVEVVIPGGSLGGAGEDSGDFPNLRTGEERLFFLNRSADGKSLRLSRGGVSARKLQRREDGSLSFDEMLRARRLQRMGQVDSKPADLTSLSAGAPASGGSEAASGSGGSISATGLMTDSVSSLPARWVAPDRGEPIPYIVDATVLPAGVTLDQALTAVRNAFAAWSAVTGMTFQFQGTQTFPSGADDVLIEDEKIRIQLHDTYGSIENANAVAIGGRWWNSADALLANIGGGGGQVAGLEFHKAVRGWVVLRHSSPQFSNLKTLEEVLCHELGHVFGMTHSSESSSETDLTKRQAIMYYSAHADNRGAKLGAYDPPVIQKAHPAGNTPPWAYPRYVTAHTGSQPQTAPGVNEYSLPGYDRQTPATALTRTAGPSVYSPTSGGTFNFTNPKVKFTPQANTVDAAVGDPLTATYAKVLYRYSDGVNCSPWQPLSVIAYKQDNFPAGGDGLPDNWMKQYWSNNANPAAGPKRGPQDDHDSDGLTNLQEYQLATSPIRGQSRFDITVKPNDILEWPAKPWALYLLESSTDAVNWQIMKAAIPPAAAGASIVLGSISAPRDPGQNRRLLRLKNVQ